MLKRTLPGSAPPTRRAHLPASTTRAPRVGEPRDRDDLDNPNVRSYVTCAHCHHLVRHTTWHPTVTRAFNGYVGGMVCSRCHTFLSDVHHGVSPDLDIFQLAVKSYFQHLTFNPES